MVASVPVIGIAGANAILGYEAELAIGRRNAAMLREIAAERHGATLAAMQDMLQGIARTLPFPPTSTETAASASAICWISSGNVIPISG
ncbi:hypothetical protein ACFQU7_20930 [Pseudoroseomonas wenyumeiae]